MRKVLHVLDIAGIASIISHNYNKQKNRKSDVIFHKKNNISSRIAKHYGSIPYSNFRNIALKGFFKALSCDIIHIHGSESLIPLFKLTGKKIVLHYHGSDIREPGRSTDKKRIANRSKADLIIYNSEKMKELIITKNDVRKVFLPNLIDTELFSNRNDKRFGSVSITSSNHDKEKTIKEIKKRFDATIIDLDKKSILYPQMANFLSSFEIYVDIRIMPWDQVLEELSTTALQALACGCKVFHNEKIIEKLPKIHEPENYIKKLDSLYSKLFETRSL